MKRIVFMTVCYLVSIMAFSQAKQPTLMVVPSTTWCTEKGYVQQFDNQGYVQKEPDYQAALQNDMELKLVIATINDLMAERGFKLKDMEQTLKIIQQQNAEMAMTTSKAGNEIAESPLDKLLRTAKADIILEVTWNVTVVGPKRTLFYNLQGKDAYTGKSLGGPTGTSAPSFSADIPTLLREAVVAHIDNFNNRLQAHFDDMATNGREVALEVRVFQDNEAGIDLESEYDGYELLEIIENWMSDNTVEHRFSTLGSSENYLSFEQVRIPLYDANGRAMDTNRFARELRRFLQGEPYNIPVKVMNRGLGKAVLVLGEK